MALRWYGLFIALGIIVGTWLTGRELSRKGLDPALALDSLFFVVPLGFVGARVYHVVTDYDLYADDPIPGVFAVWNGGLGIYGAVAGGFLGLVLFGLYRGVSPLVLADAAAPGLILAQAIGRWGNYFNQELFGRPSDLPWAIRISPENRPAQFADVDILPPDLPLRVDLEPAGLRGAPLGSPPLRGLAQGRGYGFDLRQPLLGGTLLRRVPAR